MKLKTALEIIIDLARDANDENIREDRERDPNEVELNNRVIDAVEKYIKG